ncbi:MAG: thioredoxin domain-containing protein [Bacteroidota bacterium]
MTNRLIHEQSPYLLQHSHNPVDWYPWGDEAFAKAKTENKPVLVSIGYAACHWCHVMERESFENETVAAYMNEHFINIKVDREEHPDVDHMYMDAVQAISGSGGWPLNVFVTPDRIPFYGGTYFPPRAAYNRPSWTELLQRMNEIFTSQPTEVSAQAEQMLQYLKQASLVGMAGKGTQWNMDTCKEMADTLLKQADTEFGGFGAAPKFPGTMAVSFLLEQYHFTKNEAGLQQALLSLDCMIAGGIYDQLGGGFARYSTDKKWLAPHFEKMLYDNALLILSLCDAYNITGNEQYKKVVEDTIAFADRELKDKSGGYYSALDADSEGVEGKFYTWTWDEWMQVLDTNDIIVAEYYGVSEHGNWEETNILHVTTTHEVLATKHNISLQEVEQRIQKVNEKLWALRATRVRPMTDDKCLLSWNALMNLALSKAGVSFQNQSYLQAAEKHMQWMLQTYLQDNILWHTWKNGTARICAKLDDHAYLIQALLQLGTASGNNKWILQANACAENVVAHFLHEDGNFFYYTSDQQKDIPVRKVDMYDGATPSANALMTHNLLLLGLCMERNDWLEQAEFMLQHMAHTALHYTYSFGYWAILLQRYAKGLKTVVCVGDEAQKKRVEMQKNYLPEAFILTSEKEIFDLPILEGKKMPGKTVIFVCTQTACLEPVTEVGAALGLL